ncbi:hypothetical protein O6P43_025841 [Quillaja saponaria]|uniref:Uncharacterized protein n=1 Tax=Quillaja saponaria TaxID=32244 RepID=A0AAD7PG21_QUISA|nr:hypothetical protein O6P43_025841 [Quillaja saponaria]
MTQYSFISEFAGILSNKLCNDNVFPSYLGCTLVGDDLQLFLAVTTVTGTAMYDCNARQHWCRWGSCLANKVHVYKALRHVTGFVRLPVPSLLLFNADNGIFRM